MRAIFILTFVAIISVASLSDVYADSKGDVYSFCKDRKRGSDEYCNCMIGEPYNNHVSDVISKKQARFDEEKARYIKVKDALLADPTLNKRQMVDICSVAEKVYIEADSFPMQKKNPKLVDTSKLPKDYMKQHAQLQKQAHKKMHDMLHAGRMSSPVYKSLAYLSSFCKSRYEMGKKEQEHSDYLKKANAGDINVDPHLFFYRNKKSCK
ncbi:MAG: hypothetical protein ACRBB3_01845 [Alphaproteobacteria bacterium]